MPVFLSQRFDLAVSFHDKMETKKNQH